MLKCLVGIILAFFGYSVQAQIPLIPKEGLPGMATVTPVSFPYVIEDATVGNHYFIITKDALGLYGIWGTSCFKGQCLTNRAFYNKVIATRALADPVAGFRDWYNQAVTFECSKTIRLTDTPQGALCREQRQVTCAILQAQYNTTCSSDTATAPPPVVWVVTSVNAYKVTGATKDLFPTGKATLGATCDCSPLTGYKFTSLFGSTFCKAEVVGATQPMVAGCSIKK